MKWFLGLIFMQFFIGCRIQPCPGLLQTTEVALANPMVKIDSILFIDQASIQITTPYPDSEVRYTTHGNEVRLQSPICPTPFFIREDSINKLTIKIYQDKIPTWHSGSGSIPWLFLDEIIVQ